MEAHPHHIPLVFMLDIINGYKKYMEKQEREQTVQHGSSVLSKKKILIYILLYI